MKQNHCGLIQWHTLGLQSVWGIGVETTSIQKQTLCTRRTQGIVSPTTHTRGEGEIHTTKFAKKSILGYT